MQRRTLSDDLQQRSLRLLYSKRFQGIAFFDKQSEVRERKMRIGSFVCPNGSGLQRLATNAYRIASEGWTPQPGHCEQLEETRRRAEDNLTYAQLDRHASSSQACPAVPKLNLSDSHSEFAYDRTLQPHVAQMAGGQNTVSQLGNLCFLDAVDVPTRHHLFHRHPP